MYINAIADHIDVEFSVYQRLSYIVLDSARIFVLMK